MKIVFAHNVYDRFLTLKTTIDIEKRLYPDSKISVAYNSDYLNRFNNQFIFDNNIKFIHFNEKPHKIGCVNGCILSIQQLLNEEFDVLIFSHDDVYIVENNINIINKHIDSIINNEFDIISRKPLKYVNNVDIYGGYYYIETVYFSKKAAIELFSNIKTLNNENEIPVDMYNSISPEVWFYRLITNKGLKINEITFDISLALYNNTLNMDVYNNKLIEQMGYYHKNVGIRGWRD